MKQCKSKSLLSTKMLVSLGIFRSPRLPFYFLIQGYYVKYFLYNEQKTICSIKRYNILVQFEFEGNTYMEKIIFFPFVCLILKNLP